jgi:DNA-binding LytR/AlgR family response regulator
LEGLYLKIAICEDDSWDAELLNQTVKRYNAGFCPEIFGSASELLSVYAAGSRYDLIFMDIQMDGIDGFTAAQILKGTYPEKRPLIVFTTAYHKYSTYGYEFAFRYAVKPLDDNYIHKVLSQAEKELEPAKIAIQHGVEVRLLQVSSIMYAEIWNVNLKIHTNDKCIIDTRMSMEKFKSLLPFRSFYQTHRCFLVGLSYVASYIPSGVKMTDGREILLSRNKRKEFEAALRSFLRGDY